jgi:hypothetical protein
MSDHLNYCREGICSYAGRTINPSNTTTSTTAMMLTNIHVVAFLGTTDWFASVHY